MLNHGCPWLALAPGRLANEAAALAAQLGVSTASLTAQLLRNAETQRVALETKALEHLGAALKLRRVVAKVFPGR